MSKKVQIGRSDVYATPLGLGTNAVGGYNLFPNLRDLDGIDVVKAGLDAGIQMLDTAFIYGLGHSEELVGQAMADYPRDQIVVADKAAQNPTRELAVDNNPEFLKMAVDDALKRMKLDYIDIFYIHFPDEATPKAEAVGALHDLKVAGKIKAIGVSNFSLDQIKAANQDGYVDVVENQYSLLHREAETDVMPYLRANQISFVPFFPLASGLLTGKYQETTQFPAGDMRQQNPDFKGERFTTIVKAVNSLQPIADAHQASIAQIILAWYIQNPSIGVVIPGAKKPTQVTSNAKALDVNLNAAEYQQIDQAFKF